MNNFVFSDSLEISVIEHRLIILFEILEKYKISFFFPSLIFNESFWQAPYEKREAIITSTQLEWIGSSAAQKSIFYRDLHFLDLLKSVKIAYFSYTKVTLELLLNLFKTQNRFSVTNFAEFGDEKESPSAFINELYYKSIFPKLPSSDILTKTNNKSAKISAVKFYKRFFKKEKVKVLVFDIQNCIDFWEEFTLSIKLIDEKQNTNLFHKIELFLTASYSEVIERIQDEIPNLPNLNILQNKNQLHLDVLNISDFSLNEKFDYIFSFYGINEIPTDIITREGSDYKNILARICYKDREDEKKAITKIAELQSPLKNQVNINSGDLNNLDYEIIWQNYTNQNAVKLLEENQITREKLYFRFSVSILSFFVKTINSLTNDGYIEAWNLADTYETRNSLSILRKSDGRAYSLIDLSIYTILLNSFEDISIDQKILNFQDYLSHEITNNESEIITLTQFFSFTQSNRTLWEKLFNLENFTWKDELRKISKKFAVFSFLKRKNILLLGLPTLLYKFGFKKFKNAILKSDKFSKLVDPTALINSYLDSYEKEYLVAATTKLFTNMYQEEGAILITKDKDSYHNNEFYKFLEKVGMDKEKVMLIVGSSWDDLINYAKISSNNEVIEISLKNTTA